MVEAGSRFPEILLLTRADIEAVAPDLVEIVDLAERTYLMEARGEADVPVKVGVHPHGRHTFLHALPAWIPADRALGMKWISYFPGNFERGMPDSSGLIVLNDPDHGLPVAIMEGMWITFVRTAACGAVAARLCAIEHPRTLALIGCGGLGTWSLRVLSAIYPGITEVRVASRTPESRLAFCARMAAEGDWDLRPVADNEQAVRGADIVVSSVPQGSHRALRGAWWSPGAVGIALDVVAAWDDPAYRMVDRIVADSLPALHLARDRRRPDLDLPDTLTSFGDILLGNAAGRTGPDERIMAIPTGIGSIDITLGWEIYRRALAAGSGRKIDLLS